MATPGTIPIYLTSDYDTIQSGLYAAQPYEYVVSFSYDLGTGVSLAALPSGKPPFWVRNSASSLWGPNEVLLGGTSDELVPVDQVDFFVSPSTNGAVLKGYYYEVFLNPTESVVIPYGADSIAHVAFSLLAHNPEGFPTNIEREEAVNRYSLTVFPNPTTGNSTLQYELSRPGIVRVTLLDHSGRTLWESAPERKTIGLHRQEISLQKLSSGMYLLRFQAGNHHSFIKLIKQ